MGRGVGRAAWTGTGQRGQPPQTVQRRAAPGPRDGRTVPQRTVFGGAPPTRTRRARAKVKQLWKNELLPQPRLRPAHAGELSSAVHLRPAHGREPPKPTRLPPAHGGKPLPSVPSGQASPAPTPDAAARLAHPSPQGSPQQGRTHPNPPRPSRPHISHTGVSAILLPTRRHPGGIWEASGRLGWPWGAGGIWDRRR